MIAGADLVSAVGRGRPGHRHLCGPLHRPRVSAPPAPFPGVAVKKGPQNPISVVGEQCGRHARPAHHDRSFEQHHALPAARHALTGLPGGGRWRGRGAHRRGARHRAPFAVPAGRPALLRSRALLAGRAAASTGAWPGAGCQGRPCAGRLDGVAGVEGGCLRSRAAGQPAPPASRRRGRAVGHRPGPRARSCRPSPPAGPGRPPGPATPPGHLLSQPVPPPGLDLPLRKAAVPAGWPVRGADLTGRAERSVRRGGSTDGPPPGAHTARGRPPPPRPQTPAPRMTGC